MKMKKCPKCGSEKVKTVNYEGVSCIICLECGYDETMEMDTWPESRSSQKEKGRYSPYKAGGKARAVKR